MGIKDDIALKYAKWTNRKTVPLSLIKKTHPDNRKIYIDNKVPDDYEHFKYCDNEIISSKYTIWNFLFKNLFEQLRRVANFYFLCIAIIELLIDSPVSPITSILPLIIVVSVTAIKQGYEDFLRHKADREVNKRKVLVRRLNRMTPLISRDIMVGDVIRVKSDEPIPCDMILLSSSNPTGMCFITTANLDGETNLKRFASLAETRQYNTCESVGRLRAYIEYEQPSDKLYEFVGLLTIAASLEQQQQGEGNVVRSLNPDNLLLRGSRLKNTDFIYGCAVYTGQDTKISKNHKTGKAKFSKIEIRMNKFLIAYLCFLISYSVTMFTIKYFYYQREKNAFERTWYLPEPEPELNISQLLDGILSFMILSNYIIPISLYVTLELQKFIGSKFFIWDKEMYDPDTNECAMALTSDLNEELGQVEYLFTDKTGTLTENEMKFRCCSIGGVKYGEVDQQLRKADGDQALADLSDDKVAHMLISLTLCHTVNVEMLKADNNNVTASKSNIEIVDEAHDNEAFELDETDAVRFDNAPFDDTGLSYDYQAQSPDEKSLIEASRRYGVIYHGTTADKIITLTIAGVRMTYELCHMLDFDADRKCMSVIVRHESDGRYELICKGADTVMLDKVISGWNVTNAQVQLDAYAKNGLRTLVIGQRWLTNDEYHEFDDVLNAAKSSLEHRAALIAKSYAHVETDLCLQGITGIEDLLQPNVPETLIALRIAGIQIWVLTGDKEETAVNISYAAGHFDEGMILIRLTKQTSKEKCIEALTQIEIKMMEFPEKRYALIIDGQSLLHVMYDEMETFLLANVCKRAVTVLGCRMSPLQKAHLVIMIKKSPGNPTTAAIGDGANDVSMIQSADLGLAITGKEGRQAVRSSDYAFAKFYFLQRALLLHGHFYYQRTAVLVQYFFYKNVAMITAQIYFAIFSGFSAQSIFDGFLLMFYNITFTSLPILAYGLFEQHISGDKLLKDPSLYRRNRKNALLSGLEFFKWTCLGIWHSLVFSYGIYFIFKYDVLSADGAVMGVYEYGTIIYTTCIITVNIKLMLHCQHMNIYIISAFFFSIFLYFGMTFIYASIVWGDLEILASLSEYNQLPLYGSLPRLFSQASTYISLVLLTVTALLPDVVIEVVQSTRVKMAEHEYRESIETQLTPASPVDVQNNVYQEPSNKFKISFTKHSGKLTFLQPHPSA